MHAEPVAPFLEHPAGLDETGGFPNTGLETARDYVAALLRTASVARALAASGRRIDLAGLDDKVGRLCARVLDLPPPEGRELRPDLMQLRSELESLAAALGQPPPP